MLSYRRLVSNPELTPKLNLSVLPASPAQLPLIHQLTLSEPHFWHIPKEIISWEFFSSYPIQWFVVSEGEEPVAVISMGNVDHLTRSACFGIIVIPSARQRGIGGRCDAVVRDLAFNKFGLHKAWASVLTDNVVMISALKKRGWGYHGLMQDAQFLDGSWRDRAYFEIINPNEVKVK